jgi:hypothetical protein
MNKAAVAALHQVAGQRMDPIAPSVFSFDHFLKDNRVAHRVAFSVDASGATKSWITDSLRAASGTSFAAEFANRQAFCG